MTEADLLTAKIVRFSQEKLSESVRNIERCLSLLTTEQVWQRPNEVSNAIGNLVIHLSGNVRQWIVAGLGGEEFARDRPAEFAQREPIAAEKLIGDLKAVVERANSVIGGLTSEKLIDNVTIQGYQVTGLSALVHVVEHFSLHTGQIVYATKIFINQDLSLYDSQGQRIDQKQTGAP